VESKGDCDHASLDPGEAKRWEGALHNNQGYALHELGRYEKHCVNSSWR